MFLRLSSGMGLEQVELVMCLEERFRVRIPDEIASRCETVADLAAAVLSQLPRRREHPYMRRFFRVRSLLMKHAGVARRDIRPAAKLEVLMPPGTRRARWRAMRAEDDLLPRLEGTMLLRRSGCIFCLVIVGVSLLSLWYNVVYAEQPMRGIAAILGGTLWCGATLLVWSVRQREFPAGLVTVADLVRVTTPPRPIPELEAERTAHEREVLDTVRELIHTECRIPLDQIRAESRLIKDLKLD